MSENEEIFRFVVANQSLEGMVMTEDEEDILRDCIEGKRSFHDAVLDVVASYTDQGV